MIRNIHDRSFVMLRGVSETAGRQYNDAMEREVNSISRNVSLEAPERAYNVVLALARLIGKYNDKISPRYDFRPSRQLSRVASLLSAIPFRDYNIDRIIEINYKR